MGQANSGSRLLWDVGCVQSRPVDRGKMCDACNIESIVGDGDEYLRFLHALGGSTLGRIKPKPVKP